MSLLQAVFLGLLQGITEFLPVSSSGHLVIAQHLLDVGEPPILFDVVLHVATLLAVLLYFKKDLIELMRAFFLRLKNPLGERTAADRFMAAIIAGTIPTVIIGFTLKDYFESAFASLDAVGVALMATGCLLLLTRRIGSDDKPLTASRAVFIGLAQGAAITPGISRSGATITAGILLGLDREKAARFSFLLSIPAILGALILQLLDGPENTVAPLVMFVGFLTAFLSGYASLALLMTMVAPGRFHRFAYYCIPLGFVVFATAFWMKYH